MSHFLFILYLFLIIGDTKSTSRKSQSMHKTNNNCMFLLFQVFYLFYYMFLVSPNLCFKRSQTRPSQLQWPISWCFISRAFQPPHIYNNPVSHTFSSKFLVLWFIRITRKETQKKAKEKREKRSYGMLCAFQ